MKKEADKKIEDDRQLGIKIREAATKDKGVDKVNDKIHCFFYFYFFTFLWRAVFSFVQINDNE